MSKKLQHHWDLDVYQMSVEAAMQIFEVSKRFPKEEIYSLTDQIRRSSRSVSANLPEAWRRRKYEHESYNNIIGKLVNMGNNPTPWILKTKT
ncbi:MAG: four helix bundle protein [Thermodesulfobacteriota bacterium]|nr:four helix bundle protein [Thermodesulfobacteriota bacterium]